MLTLAELEAFACAGTTRFLPLDNAGVAPEETFLLESNAVFGVNLYEGPCDAHADGLSLTLESAATYIDLDVIVVDCAEGFERLQYHLLELRNGEILLDFLAVDFELAGACGQI